MPISAMDTTEVSPCACCVWLPPDVNCRTRLIAPHPNSRINPMDYPYENLGPERFQHLVQALLTREYPDVQCFPVAQPDGGRDAVAYFYPNANREFLVFQVKFVRKPLALADPHKWLEETINREGPKVSRLVPKGASRFILITNVPGTAHAESGSIDKVARVLDDNMDVPASCWWRDDLSRRLDGAWDIKWIYPELMTGPDLLRGIIETGLSEDRDRRTAAIRAFVADQFASDQEVKFKQVELQNRLLDLFIDVPIETRGDPESRRQFIGQWLLHRIAVTTRNTADVEPGSAPEIAEGGSRESYLREERPPVGAATVLLNSELQERIPQVVLEGAPGQGKSTITQYICQVHRMRIMKLPDLLRVPESHRWTAVRLPFKVDLRDLATWLGGKDPFGADLREVPADRWHRSLEAFLAAQVQHHSGGVTFNVSDLHAIAKLSAVLLVFDGLDEVADIGRRREVVEEITKGVNRLRESCASLQVIITSRPAAFANSPGFSPESFPHFQLGSLTRPLIDLYASKWLDARRVGPRERLEFKGVLDEKLSQPHLRDLARNPMQLAILLSLVLTRGASLPDKRTALYDNYIELFFSRESEKSSLVRVHRDLLIDIHRFLAWTLHAEAEQGNESGSINTSRLITLLESYLVSQGHDAGLAEALFTGMVERVVALVSRVEGTFEFEVQPLREYFAARFLYETAPYSPPGRERRGTKPDRFDALARNFYWLNVTRFYAGCFSKGELPSLIDRLEELTDSPEYSRTSHPRVLAAMLLSDWVFSQHPRSVRDVVRLILDGMGLRFVLSSNSRRIGTGVPLVLPKNCGQGQLVEHCFEILRADPAHDYALDIIELLNSNAGPDELKPTWDAEISSRTGPGRTTWLEYGLLLRLLSPSLTPLTELLKLMEDEPGDSKRLDVISRARRTDYIESSEPVFASFTGAVLERTATVPAQRRSPSALSEQFANALSPHWYAMAFHNPQPIPLHAIWSNLSHEPFTRSTTPTFWSENSAKCAKLVAHAVKLSSRPARDWGSSLESWDALVEYSRAMWGEHWAHFALANVSAGVRSPTERCADYNDMFDSKVSLCKRARYARLRAGASSWWKRQVPSIPGTVDGMFLNLSLMTWASEPVIVDCLRETASIVDALDAADWRRLHSAVTQAIALTREQAKRRYISFSIYSLPEKLSPRVATLLGARATLDSARQLYERYLNDYTGSDELVLLFAQRAALDPAATTLAGWRKNVEAIRRSYLRGAISARYATRQHARFFERMPLEVATEVADRPHEYPGYVVAFAELRCRSALAAKIVPVGEVAARDGWFVDGERDRSTARRQNRS